MRDFTAELKKTPQGKNFRKRDGRLFLTYILHWLPEIGKFSLTANEEKVTNGDISGAVFRSDLAPTLTYLTFLGEICANLFHEHRP